MNKFKLSMLCIGFLAATYSAFAQVTVLWNFSDGTGAYASGTPDNFQVSVFTIGNSLGTVNSPISSTSASSGYASASGTNNLGNAQAGGAFSATTSGYFQFTITPNASYRFAVSDFDFGVRSTSTGAQFYDLRASTDNFATSTSVTTGSIATNSSWSYKDNTFTSFVSTAIGQTVTFRLYAFGNSGSPSNNTVTTRLDDISLTVSTIFTAPNSAVPEPASFGLLAGLMVFAGVASRRGRRV